MTPPASVERQRIDKWLWHARVVRTRSAAAALASSGHVRINGARIDAPSRAVKTGDVVTVALDRIVRVLKVLDFAERRGPSEAGRALYEDLAPPLQRGAQSETAPAVATPAAVRDPGAGRPTKRDRRALDRLFGDDA